ncbi:hypothetical protein NRY95_06980 [Xanthomonas campestris pv. phormiicola]|nr:hypothetical protein [Xanthomonas campestris pv. phormiicola]UYC17689.1 hypothetical protein NRY95_06980 [Xanthomonas campestris pv. phormiicola]
MNTIPIGNTYLIRSFILLFFATAVAWIGWEANELDWQTVALYGCMAIAYGAVVFFYFRALRKRRPFVNYGYAVFLLGLSLLALASGLIFSLARLLSG